LLYTSSGEAIAQTRVSALNNTSFNTKSLRNEGKLLNISKALKHSKSVYGITTRNTALAFPVPVVIPANSVRLM
jgi:hypothetical protein